MRNLSKNKNLIISILLLMAFVVAAFCLVFLPKTTNVYADNYGELQDAGNYVYNNVSFYAIKIKKTDSYTQGANGNFPTGYELSLKDGKIQTVKYGETVLLNSDEYLLIAFARQDAPEDEKVLVEGFDSVDFLSATLKFNGKNPVEAPIGQSSTGNAKFFAYVIDLENAENEEGLVEFGADYQEISGLMAHYDFKFYLFNKSTYQRTEVYNNTLRPNTTIDADYVVDKQNASKFYGEYFYNYQDQNLVTLTYNPQRYELEITKTIHSASTNYSFSYDVVKGEVVYSNVPSLSTNETYSRDLFYKQDNENVVITFKDLGVYQISYKAVYFNQNNTKTYLESLNEEYNKQDRLTIFGVQSTYNDYLTSQTEFRSPDNTISADITGKAIENKFVTSGTVNTTNISLTDEEISKIASSNQPQIEFLFDATIKSTFDVYELNLNGTNATLSVPTNDSNPKLTESGYYFIKVTYTFDRYKEWLGSSSNTNTKQEFTQYFLLRIKDQIPTVEVKDENNNDIMSGYYDASGNYHGSYISGSVSIKNKEEQTVFDMPTTFTLEKKSFNSNVWENVQINSNNEVEIHW